MNLIYQTNTRNSFDELKTTLEDNKIKYKELDSDAFKLGFKVSSDNANDFQMNLANLVGSRCPGNFFSDQ